MHKLRRERGQEEKNVCNIFLCNNAVVQLCMHKVMQLCKNKRMGTE